MSKTLIVGDVHLGKGVAFGKPGIGNALNSRVADQVRLLNWILDQGIDHQVDRMIITGDIFEDVKPDSQLIVLFLEWLKRCADNNIECHIIAGNHDVRRTGSWYTSILDCIAAVDLANTTVYKNTQTIHTAGACFTLLPFRDRLSLGCSTVDEALVHIEGRLPYELADIPAGCIRVLVGHIALEGSFYTSELGDAANELMCPTRIFAGYDYVFMGHVHKPQVLSKTPHIEHVGSIDLSEFSEAGQTKILVLFDPNSTDIFQHIPIPTRPMVRIREEITTGTDPTEYLLTLLSNLTLTNALVKLEIKHLDPDGPQLDRERIIEEIQTRGAHYISNFSESRNVAVVPEDKKALLDSTVDPKSAILLYADMLDLGNDQSEFISFCNECVDEHYSKEKS